MTGESYGSRDQIIRCIAKGFDFNGCTDSNPDICECGTWTPTECPICDQEIVDGQEIITIIRVMYPYLPDNDSYQEWDDETWHAACDLVGTPSDAELAAARDADHARELLEDDEFWQARGMQG